MQLQELKGIGPKRALLFARLGIRTAEELLLSLPVSYEDRSIVTPLDALTFDGKVLVEASVTDLGRPLRLRGHLSLVRGKIADATGSAEVVWHNQPYVARNLRIGDSFYFFGTWQSERGQLSNPQFCAVSSAKSEEFRGLMALYSLTGGLSQGMRRSAVQAALEAGAFPEDPWPEEWLQLAGFLPYQKLLQTLHRPESREALMEAERQWSLRQALLQALLRKSLADARARQVGPPMRHMAPDAFLRRLPFSLTATQKEAVDALLSGLANTQPMNVLLQGDVGSGKTVVAFAAADSVLANGYHVAFMAPTEVLARQHYESARSLFPEQPIWLLTGSTDAQERKRVAGAARSDVPGLFFGTHALFQESLSFSGLGLVITDEQHRFGVRQRGKLQEKLEVPNTIVLSATPIPRTLELVEWGDLEMVRLVGRPPGRKPVVTSIVSGRSEGACYRGIAREIAKGHQAYLVCPRIEEGEDEVRWSVENTAGRVRRFFAKEPVLGRPLRLDILTGRMSAEEKQEAMDRFARGETDLLLATTVIEVGIDVPNATVMMIAGAEHFGLAQLHQLRGRVGRGSAASYCVLLASSITPAIRQRLEILAQTEDGLEIARTDLRLRGAGTRMGTRQHGTVEDAMTSVPAQTSQAWSEEFLRLTGADPSDPSTIPPRMAEQIASEVSQWSGIAMN